MFEVLAAGVALTFIFEGILPFVAPRMWRDVFRKALELNDGTAALLRPDLHGRRPGAPLLRPPMRKWLLPEHIEDVLPPEARLIEQLRRAILDLFESHGYELVAPPLLEYVESLLSGTGRDLDLATFKLVDQLSGRMMGLRADHTPQVARIDAHLLNRQGVARLCYCGSVLHTRPAGMTKMREPDPDRRGALRPRRDRGRRRGGAAHDRGARAGRHRALHIDLGNPAIYRALAADVKGDRRRAVPRGAAEGCLARRTARHRSPPLNGGAEVLERARRELPAQAQPALQAGWRRSPGAARRRAWRSLRPGRAGRFQLRERAGVHRVHAGQSRRDRARRTL
jgi:uncharacterized protein YjeT (DUF2065 family)